MGVKFKNRKHEISPRLLKGDVLKQTKFMLYFGGAFGWQKRNT